MTSNRRELIAEYMQAAGLDALVCALPKNVLLLSGYWPVVGTAVAVASSNGDLALIVPEDETDFAHRSSASEIKTFRPSSLDQITTAAKQLVNPLAQMLSKFAGQEPRVGYENGPDSEPSSYAAVHLYQGEMLEVIREASRGSRPSAADEIFRKLSALKSADDISRIEIGCRIAKRGFENAAEVLRAGVTEIEAAAEIRKRFACATVEQSSVQRAEAFVFVMSGANSVKASGAFAHSTGKQIANGDLVLIHCNSFADGYCTDITRTFSMGQVDDKRQAMYESIFAARQAAFSAIVPGGKAADVDHAARQTLRERGFGEEFKHSTGHGVGFGAISPDALPRLHPKSDDILTSGMVFNVEPAIYIEQYGGMRHCDMVAVTETGFHLLTPFLSRPEELVVRLAH